MTAAGPSGQFVDFLPLFLSNVLIKLKRFVVVQHARDKDSSTTHWHNSDQPNTREVLGHTSPRAVAFKGNRALNKYP